MTASRGLVHAILVIGSSTSVGIVLGIIRVKVVALLLGATGVGVLGIFENIHQMGQIFAGLGMDQSGVRRVAASLRDPLELARIRRTLIIANLVQGILGMVGLWLLRERISIWMFNDSVYGLEVGLLGIGVLLSLIAASQTAQLQGMRRIDDLAKVGILACVLTTIGGIVAVLLLGAGGLVIFVLAQPAFVVLVAARYVARLPHVRVSMNISGLWQQWRSMAGLGATFLLAGLLVIGGLLVARSLIVDRLGLDAAGHFHAAWAISMQCVGLLLGAMGTDYFPRLSGIIGDRSASSALVNDQVQISFALGGPILLFMLGFAPWVIPLFFSGAFDPAVDMLQWMCFGNVLRLATWSLGFVLIARDDRLVFAGVEILWHAVFLGLLWALLPALGVTAAGLAFVVAYAVALPAHYWAVWRMHGLLWHSLSLQLFAIHVGLSAALLALAKAAPLAGAIAGLIAGIATGVWGLRLVAAKIGPDGKLGRFATGLFRILHWPLPDGNVATSILHPDPGE